MVTQVYKQGAGTTKTATYGYDNLSRLTRFVLSPSGSSPTDSQLVAYDLNGNIALRTEGECR